MQVFFEYLIKIYADTCKILVSETRNEINYYFLVCLKPTDTYKISGLDISNESQDFQCS